MLEGFVVKKILLVAAVVAVLASGCAIAPYDPYYDAPVRVAPPPPRSEYPGYPPAPDYLWVSGYWNWGGGRYVWAPGRWESPRPGYYWTPHRWEREGDHWRQQGGRWEHDARPGPAPRPAPRSEPQSRPDRDSAPRYGYEREAQRAPEASPDYRQQRDSAPRVERDARAAPDRTINSRDGHGNRQHPDRKDDPRSNRRPQDDH